MKQLKYVGKIPKDTLKSGTILILIVNGSHMVRQPVVMCELNEIGI